MKIQIDENGYVKNYVIVGESSACDIEVHEPEGFSPDNFKAWKYDGDKLVYDGERAKALEIERNKDEIRFERQRVCFPVVNRGQFWYDTLTQNEKDEIREWYQKWLDAPETGIIPDDLDFIKRELI